MAYTADPRVDVYIATLPTWQQAISIGIEQWLASATLLPLARLLAALLGLILEMSGRSMKRRQQIEKCLEREAGQHLEHDRLGGNPSKCQHHESPQSCNVIAIIPYVSYFRLSLLNDEHDYE